MKYITKLQEAAADEYIGMTDEEDEETSLEPKADKEIEFVDLHTVNLTPHPTAPEHQFKALSVTHDSHKGGASEKRNGERTPPRQGNSPTFKQIRMRESYDLDEADRAGAPLTLSGAIKKAVDQAVSLITSKEGNKKKNYADWEAKTTFGPKLKAIVKSKVGLGESFINEELKPGSLKLKSGETIKVTNEDASKINKVLSSLNSTNQKKMEEELLKDKNSYQRMLKFAREAN